MCVGANLWAETQFYKCRLSALQFSLAASFQVVSTVWLWLMCFPPVPTSCFRHDSPLSSACVLCVYGGGTEPDCDHAGHFVNWFRGRPFLFHYIFKSSIKASPGQLGPIIGRAGGAINVSLRGSAAGSTSRETKAPGIEYADLGVHLLQETSLRSTAH